MTSLITPKININGSSADDLINPRIEADRLIGEVIAALQQATPNGRDYPGDNNACVADRELHYERIKALRSLQDTLFQEALTIKRQVS